MTEELREAYEKLRKKYSLPKFDETNSEFEISDIESEEFLLRNILRRIGEKIEYYSNLMNDILQPDTSSLSSMHETRFFLDDEKANAYNVFKTMMKHYRHIIELSLENDEPKQAKFLKDFNNEWKKIKQQLMAYVIKMKESWDKETSMEQDLGYFG